MSLVLVAIATACTDSPAPFIPAAHPSFAAANIPKQSGPVIPHPRLVTVTFAGYPYEADVQAFGAWLPTSSWLAAVGAEYGVMAGSDLGRVILPGPAPASVTLPDVAAMLAAGVRDGTLPSSPDSSVEAGYIYSVYYPATTTVHIEAGDAGCAAAGGFHASYSDGTLFFAFAAIPSNCTAAQQKLGVTPIQFIEFDASHEIIEAASDPYLVASNGSAVAIGAPAWDMSDHTNPWFAFGGEIGDACTEQAVTVDGYTVTRVWSNAAATADGDPCVPGAGPYIGVYPADDHPTVAAGGTTTIALTGFSSERVAPWTLRAATGPFVTGTFVPAATLDTDKFDNASNGSVTISVPAGTPSGSTGIVFLAASAGAPTLFGNGKIWPMMVTVR